MLDIRAVKTAIKTRSVSDRRGICTLLIWTISASHLNAVKPGVQATLLGNVTELKR
jgi:hypothetical protein